MTAACRAMLGGGRSASARTPSSSTISNPSTAWPEFRTSRSVKRDQGDARHGVRAGYRPGLRGRPDERDGRATGRCAFGAAARRVLIEPVGEVSRLGRILLVPDRDGDSPVWTARQDRAAPRADRLGEEDEQASQALLGRGIVGQDIQGACQQGCLVAGEACLLVRARYHALGKQVWRSDRPCRSEKSDYRRLCGGHPSHPRPRAWPG